MRYICLMTGLVLSMAVMAQPTRRIQEQELREQQGGAVELTQRARAQYNTQSALETDVEWSRDIYRELDLNNERNAALYYPSEPLGEQVNFFTMLLRLLLDGKIKAYEYRLDGNELFTKDNELDVKNMLEKFYIYYQEDENGKLSVALEDIPCAEVQKYYIKESNYVDRRTSTYSTHVMAICPVIMRADYGAEPVPYPMFWLDYNNISSYLRITPAMTSSYNNTRNMSLDDYFVMGRYEGKIYKTSNLQNKPLADYCKTDSAMAAEQERIESELSTFENQLWNSSSTPKKNKVQNSEPESEISENGISQQSKKEDREPVTRETKTNNKQTSAEKPRISVRRER
ncbi:MAG: gliding motility protein GldN [Bacteroidaceae bacterium]|nr:gliding motility protein GldN [Bacteroidaceae bacterium]